MDKTVLTIENWLSKVVRLSASGGSKGKVQQTQEGELMLEVDQVRTFEKQFSPGGKLITSRAQGLHGLETLLNDHMDAALDKLTSWALRNTFEIPDDLRLTLVSLSPDSALFALLISGTLQPWHEGLDFDRGVYVASLPEGEVSVQKNIEELREQVENVRDPLETPCKTSAETCDPDVDAQTQARAYDGGSSGRGKGQGDAEAKRCHWIYHNNSNRSGQ